MMKINRKFKKLMKVKRSESNVVGEIEDVIIYMCEGNEGEIFKNEEEKFCERKKIDME